jgi:uncharacterized tellurite resistance protein B-like protein
MIDLVKTFFGMRGIDKPESDPGHDMRIATCALLMEMAEIDGEFTAREREEILTLLKTNYGLSDEHATALMEAAAAELKDSIDLWRFAKLINRNYSVEEKMKVIETIWQLVYSDERLDKHEDYLMHKMAQLLRLSHRQLMDAKMNVKAGKARPD